MEVKHGESSHDGEVETEYPLSIDLTEKRDLEYQTIVCPRECTERWDGGGGVADIEKIYRMDRKGIGGVDKCHLHR